MLQHIKTLANFLLVLFLSFFAILPLTIPGFFPMHDDTQPARVQQMAQSLKDGMFPVRWVADLGYGYGYPLFNFYAPFAYYIGASFIFLGFNALIATKFMMGLPILFAGISMYFLAKQFWGTTGGIISGLLYVYAPYTAVNLYVRGDVAELWAYGFIPTVFLGLYKIIVLVNQDNSIRIDKSNIKNQISKIQRRNKKVVWSWMTVIALSYSAIILSHNLTAMMVTPFIFCTILISDIVFLKDKNLYALRYTLSAILLGILLSTFYWLPALTEMKYTNVLSQIGGKADYNLHFVCPEQLWESNWGFGGSTPSCVDGMSFRIGKLHISLTILSLCLLPVLKRKSEKLPIVLAFFGVLVGIFFSLHISSFIWNMIPIIAFFQYPWRFLLLISFFSSFVGGSIVLFKQVLHSEKSKQLLFEVTIFLFVIAGVYILYGRLFKPQYVQPKTAEDYVSTDILRWNISRISDEYLPKNFQKPLDPRDRVQDKFLVLSGKVAIQEKTNKTASLVANILSKTDSKIRILTTPFPAWQVFYNNTKLSYSATDKGIEFVLPPSSGELKLVYVSTPFEYFGNIVSLIGITLLFIGIIGLPVKRNLFSK